MKKAELERYAVPVLPKSRRDAVYRAQSVRYLLRSGYSPDKKTLVVAFYDRASAANGFSLPTGILYLRKDEYLTKTIVNSEVKWRECRIMQALEIGYRVENVCLTQMDRKRILAFLKRWSDSPQYYEEKKEKLIHCLLEQFQTDILERRLKEKKERRAAEIDLRMTEVPEQLPKSFSRWVDEKALLRSRYLYYRRVKRNIAACHCTHCQRDFLLKRGETKPFPTHNKEGRCPHCGSVVIFKATGRTKELTDRENSAIMQRTRKGEVVVRYFGLERQFGNPCFPPKTGYREEGRLFLSPKGEITGEYKYGYSVKTGRYGWYAVNDQLAGQKEEIDFVVRLGLYQSYENLWFEKKYLFTGNLHVMLKRLNLSFDLKRVFRDGKTDVTSYLLRSFTYPFAPSLYRIGLEKVGKDLLQEYFDPISAITSGPLHKQLGVSKKELGWARENGWGMKEINFIAKLRDPVIQEDEVRWFTGHEIPIKSIQTLRQFTTYHRMIRYLVEQQKQKGHYAYSTLPNIIGQWKDYLEMCEKLGYDRKQDRILFPCDLREEHDKVVQLVQIQRDAEMDQKIQKVYPMLDERYHYQEDGYLIRPPRDFEDFVQEGVALLHCVCTNGYYRGHVEGNHLIFFVRNAADVESPFEVQETYVTGVCTLYPDRLAGPQEYAIRERSIVERAGRPLSACAQEAKDLAFQSAVRRMEGFVSAPKPAASPVSAAVKESQKEKAAPKPETPPPASKNTLSPEEATPAPTSSVPEPAQTTLTPPPLPRRLELGDLRPASSLIAAAPKPEPDSEEQRIEKARSMEISILGKLHECNGWTAGRLLNERPEIIVDLVRRYKGPKEEEKEALRTLYNEALLRVGQAA